MWVPLHRTEGPGIRDSSGSQEVALLDPSGQTPNGFASPAGVIPTAQPGLGSGDAPWGSAELRPRPISTAGCHVQDFLIKENSQFLSSDGISTTA